MYEMTTDYFKTENNLHFLISPAYYSAANCTQRQLIIHSYQDANGDDHYIHLSHIGRIAITQLIQLFIPVTATPDRDSHKCNTMFLLTLFNVTCQ